MSKSFVEFINHASILISNGNKSILSDPWYVGTSFDDGWKLLFENEHQDISKILDKTNYIWISHEHPDHFSIKFLKDYNNSIKENNIEFIFQNTVDKRVVKFLDLNHFKFRELKNNEEYIIDNNFKIKIQKSDFYDSALITEIDGSKIFNLNDCPLKSDEELNRFKNKYGTCDFLFTQFSYAAWKGGKNNINWRKNSAKEKINTLLKQSNILNSKYTIPFASFISFCDPYNFYLNDSVNTPKKIIEKQNQTDSKIVFLKPYQRINIKSPNFNEEGYKFWQNVFENRDYNTSKDVKKYEFEDLNFEFQNYIKRINKNNSKLLIKFLSMLKFLGIFQPLIFSIRDLNLSVKIDIANEIFEKTKDESHIEINSRSLYLIFNQDFGFDTLTVNGCFEEKKIDAFSKMSKTFAIGNLNNLGIKLNIYILLNFKIIFLFFKKLIFVKKKLKLN